MSDPVVPADSASQPPMPTPGDLGVLLHRLEEAQRQVNELERQLEHTARLAALGTLSATVAHEFNNLLMPAMNYAGFALRSLDSGSPDMELIRKALVKCHASGEKAGRISSAILGLARTEPDGTPDSCDVSTAVDEALQALGRDPAKEGISVRCNVPPDLQVAVGSIQLEHVLLNLLMNARQALNARRGRRGSIQIVAATEGSNRVRISLSDTGCGIPADQLERIFEPFYTTRDGRDAADKTRGTGLGLSLCRQIVQRHGGRICVESTLGQGTTFHLLLPAVETPASR